MASTMTPLERYKAAARLEELDQVPVMPFLTGHYNAWFNDMLEGDYWEHAEAKLKAQVKVQEQYEEVMLYPGIWPEFGTGIEASSLGGEVRFSQHASPQVEPFLKTVDEIMRLEPPDPHKAGIMPLALDTLKYMIDHAPQKYIDEFGYLQGCTFVIGPTDVAGLTRGYDKFSMDLYRNPEAAHHLLNVAAEAIIAYAHAQEEVCGKMWRFMCGDDAISFLSQKHFEEFSLPYLQRIFEEFDYAEIKLFHCDGNTTHLLNCITDIGMNVFNFDQNMDIALVKEKIGDEVCLHGNLSALGTMLEGSPEDVDTACKHIIEVAGPGGGLIISTGSGTARGTPTENIKAMIAAGEKYGRHPS